LAASCAAGPVPPLDELPLEEPLLADWMIDEPLLDELPLDFAPDELPLADEPLLLVEPPLLDELLLPDEPLLLDEPLLPEVAPTPSVDAATIECDEVPHGSVPVKV
jgi:hypothetical protein